MSTKTKNSAKKNVNRVKEKSSTKKNTNMKKTSMQVVDNTVKDPVDEATSAAFIESKLGPLRDENNENHIGDLFKVTDALKQGSTVITKDDNKSIMQPITDARKETLEKDKAASKSNLDSIMYSGIQQETPNPPRVASQQTKDAVTNEENRQNLIDGKAPDSDRAVTLNNPTGVGVSNNPNENITAKNEEKEAADEINRKASVVLPGIESRNEDLQNSVLDATIQKIVKKHILGQDITGNMMRHMYNSFKIVNIEGAFGYRRAHMFMTVPDCCIFDTGPDAQNNPNPFMNDSNGGIKSRSRDDWYNCLSPELRNAPDLANFISDGNIDVAMYLDASTRWTKHRRNVWNFPMMNNARTLSGLPSFDLKTRQGPMNFRNNYTEMVLNSSDSLSGNTINITFNDDKDCTIARMLYIWTKYAEAVGDGLIRGRGARNKIIDYMSTIYVLITDETNTKLKYWFSFIGCFPKARNYDYLSLNFPVMSERNTITVPFKVTVPVDMHPSILAMFNQVSAIQDDVDRDLIDPEKSFDYDFSKGNVAGINPLMDNRRVHQGGYYSDMFFITTKRPRWDEDKNRYIIDRKTQAVTDMHGRIDYYLVMSNRSSTIPARAPNDGTPAPVKPYNVSDPYQDKLLNKNSIGDLATSVRKVTGNPENIIAQTISNKQLGDYTMFFAPTSSYKSNLR